jgi:hypothetical protein
LPDDVPDEQREEIRSWPQRNAPSLPLDFGRNFVLADSKCNGQKRNRGLGSAKPIALDYSTREVSKTFHQLAAREEFMHLRTTWALVLTLATVGVYAQQYAGGSRDGTAAGARPAQTMKPLVRGTQYAATALMPQASLAAERILHDGGNAFDAIVAGEVVLGVV